MSKNLSNDFFSQKKISNTKKINIKENGLERILNYIFTEEKFDKDKAIKKLKEYCKNNTIEYFIIPNILGKISNTKKEYELSSQITKLKSIEKSINLDGDNEINKRINKLVNIIKMDCFRIDQINEIKLQANKIKEENSKLHKRLNKANQEIADSKKEYIAILGIFASIMLSFVAGLTFTNSILANMHSVSTPKLMLIFCVLALFLIGILKSLFNFLKDICNKQEDNNQECKKCENIILKIIITIICTAVTIVIFGVFISNDKVSKFYNTLDKNDDNKTINLKVNKTK